MLTSLFVHLGSKEYLVLAALFTVNKVGNMQHFRLLRNNRETGPYTQQEIIDLGLKAHDLIWMEGKSSSWKYPSEVEPLKPYAPPATEDIYALYHTPKLVRQSNFQATTTTQKTAVRRYVSVILPATQPIVPISVIAKPLAEPLILPKVEYSPGVFHGDNHVATTHTVPFKSTNRYLIAAAFLVLLATGIYFGTASKNQSPAHPDNADLISGSLVSLTSEASGQNNASTLEAEVPRLKSNLSLDFAALKRYVQVSTSEYNVGFFGGISGLELTVKNSGREKLTKIVLTVDYLLKNKVIHHSENLSIPSIEPKMSITIQAPDSPEGIAVQTRVIGINELYAQ